MAHNADLRKLEPIFQDTDGWYFWNETWTYAVGPFDTEAEAKEAIGSYAGSL